MNQEKIEQLKKIIERAKQNYNIEEIIKYINTTFNMKASDFANAVKNNQNYFTIDDKELLYDIAYDYSRFQFKYAVRLKTILDLKNESDIINYLISIDCIPSNLKIDVDKAEKNKIFSESETIKLKQIYEIYKIISEPIFKERQNKAISEGLIAATKDKYSQELEKAKTIINDIMNSNQNIDSYLQTNNLTQNDYLRCLRILSSLEDPLYEEYKKYTKSKSSQVYMSIVANGKKVVSLIINGVPMENNKIRNFDIIDYYETTSLNFQDFLNIIKVNLTAQEVVEFRKFANRNNNFTTLVPEQVYSQKQIFGVQFDKNNNPIPGTGRLIEKYEKENLINYLKDNHIPLTVGAYNAAFKRWKEGNLKMPTTFAAEEETTNKTL